MTLNNHIKKLLIVTLVLLILVLFSMAKDVLRPVYQVIIFLLVPLILSGYIFYALRPLKLLLLKVIKRETLASVIVFVCFLLIMGTLIGLISNMFITQVREILSMIDVDSFVKGESKLMQTLNQYFDADGYLESLISQAKNYFNNLVTQFSGFIGGISSLGTQLIIMVIAVFYLLKDEKLIRDKLESLEEGKYQIALHSMFLEIHEILKTYISGQMMVALILGILMVLSYSVIKLPYAIVLGLLALILNLIPFIGSILTVIPAMLIAATISFSMVIKVLIINILMQQLESNLISPAIMGQKMSIHPFIVIVVVLACLKLLGVIGALIATPLYMTIHTIIKAILKIRREEKLAEEI